MRLDCQALLKSPPLTLLAGSARVRIAPITLLAGSARDADPARNVRGTISVIFGNQVFLRVHYCKRDEVRFTTLLCKPIDRKMALYRECCFY